MAIVSPLEMASYHNFQPSFGLQAPSMDLSFMAQPSVPGHKIFCGLPYIHFALIYMDGDGTVHCQASQSISKSCQEMPWTKMMDAFLSTVGISRECNTLDAQVPIPKPISPPDLSVGSSCESNIIGDAHMQVSIPVATPIQPVAWSTYRQCWPCMPLEDPPQECKGFHNDHVNMSKRLKTMISVRDRDLLVAYYARAFDNLQQVNCRILSKAYIKAVEPHKKLNFPYNGRKVVGGVVKQFNPNTTKPPWWPSGVTHREPDHLPKVERIRLLVHIIREMHISHGVSVSSLEAADRPIRHQISRERLQILDELYHVRREEEKFLDGITDGHTMVWVSRAHLP